VLLGLLALVAQEAAQVETPISLALQFQTTLVLVIHIQMLLWLLAVVVEVIAELHRALVYLEAAAVADLLDTLELRLAALETHRQLLHRKEVPEEMVIQRQRMQEVVAVALEASVVMLVQAQVVVLAAMGLWAHLTLHLMAALALAALPPRAIFLAVVAEAQERLGLMPTEVLEVAEEELLEEWV